MKKNGANGQSESFAFELEPIRGYPELRWAGKRPFRSTQYYPAQLKEIHGPEVDGWRNELYWGDNLQVMSHLLKKYRGKIDLIYVDPPFDSKADYKKSITLRGKSATTDQSCFEEKQYSDIWTNDEYLQFMYERVVLMRELLAPKGCFFLHCDWHQGHYLRCMLDEVFGREAFRNEIVWYYYNKMQGNVGRFASNHDVLYFYAPSRDFTFHQLRELRDKPVEQIKRVWDKETQSLVNAKDDNGNVVYITSTHKTIDDVWRLSMLQPADRTEVVGYPTQKPESLLERVIASCSNPGDLVFDCFMGCGTTQAVAMKLGRRFLGADVNLGAVQATTGRLIGEAKELQKPGYVVKVKNGLPADGVDGPAATVRYPGFSVSVVNDYDVFRNPTQAKELLIEALEIQPLGRAGSYDGEKDGRMVKIMPINRIATRQDLNEIIATFNYKLFDKRKREDPGRPVERLLLVCMGHEPDLKAHLEKEVPYLLDVQIVDILRDREELQFRRDSEAKISVRNERLRIDAFYPMNLLQKLSMAKKDVANWREMVESVMVDVNFDGKALRPSIVDIPDGEELVKGEYELPPSTGVIRVKITDVLSESWEGEVERG